METLLVTSNKTSVSVLTEATNIGIIRNNNKTIFVDSGNSPENAKELLNNEIIHKNKIIGIINTHSHSDHSSGNNFLQKNTNCRIFASQKEALLLGIPETQTALLWGAYPLPEIRSPFLEGISCNVTDIVSETTEFPLKEFDIKIFSLPGHYFDDIGVLVCKDSSNPILFLGDCLLGKDLLKTHLIPYVYNVKFFKKSLKKISKIKAKTIIPSHSEIITTEESFQNLIKLNEDKVLQVEEILLDIFKKERTFEQGMKKIGSQRNINFSLTSYLLVGHAVRSYLSSLIEDKKLSCKMEKNFLVFKTIS